MHAVLLGLAFTLAACGGTTSNDPDGSGGAAAAGGNTTAGSGGAVSSGGSTGCDAPSQVFRVVGGCATTNCHDGTTSQSGLNLSVADPLPALLNKPTDRTGVGSACNNSTLLIINEAVPEQSLIYLKQSPTAPCGSPMPFPIGPTDNGAAAACVLSWIRSRLD